MAIGEAGPTPVLVVETQMGAPAAQIVMNEVLSEELTSNEYKVGHKKIDLANKVVIRVGTAGGINCQGRDSLKLGDVVNATHSIGATGAVMQSLSRLDFWRPEAQETFRARWVHLGSDFTYTSEGHPRVECSSEIVNVIEAAGEKLIPRSFQNGGNITKDSLYSELAQDVFLDLCRTENCRTTEMELSAIAVAAREHNANFGMISAIVGILPGSSFGEEKLIHLAERRAIQVALESTKGLG
jgi:uridine phosphorylase